MACAKDVVVTGTLYGEKMTGNEFAVQAFHSMTETDLWIFAEYDDKYLKMTAVKVDAIHKSERPASESDRYVTISQDAYTYGRESISSMWDGNYGGYETHEGSGDGYEVKDVVVTCTPLDGSSGGSGPDPIELNWILLYRQTNCGCVTPAVEFFRMEHCSR
jgi:hypothetical protein